MLFADSATENNTYKAHISLKRRLGHRRAPKVRRGKPGAQKGRLRPIPEAQGLNIYINRKNIPEKSGPIAGALPMHGNTDKRTQSKYEAPGLGGSVP